MHNLDEAPEGYRWATLSRVYDEDVGFAFRVNTTDTEGQKIALVDEPGHVACLVPTTIETAEQFLESDKKKKLYDPIEEEEFELRGIIAEAAGVAKHRAETGRGKIRIKVLGGAHLTRDELQAEILGAAPLKPSEAEIAAAFEDGGIEAVTQMLRNRGQLG